MFGGAAAQLVSRLRVVGAPLLAGGVAVLGAVHVQRGPVQVRGTSSAAWQRAGGASSRSGQRGSGEQDVGQSSVVVGGRARGVGVVVVTVPALTWRAEVSGGGGLCRRGAPVIGLTSAEVLGGAVAQPQIQTGRLHPERS